MNDEMKFGILLSLDDNDFTSDLKFAAAYTKAVAKQMKEDATIKLDYTYEDFTSSLVVIKSRLAEIKDEMSSTEDPAELKLLNKEAEELNDTLKFMTENYRRYLAAGEKATKKIDVNLKTSIKQVSKLALGLVGIRGIWSVLYRASHAYMNDNKVINEQLKITFNILSQAIGPVIKTLVNIVEYGAIVIAKLIQAFTKFNILEKAQASTLKDLAKAAKKAHSALASFDTITNLTDNSDALEDYNAALEAYNDFLEKIKTIDKIWRDWKPLILGIVGSMALLWGVKTISGLATLIGTAGTATTAGSGLMGVLSVLGLIAGITTTGIAVNKIVKIATEDTDIKSDLKWLDAYLNGKGDLGKYYKGFYDFFADADERIKNLQDKIKKNNEIIEQYKELVKTQNLSADELNKIDIYAQDIIDQTKRYKDILEEAGKDTSEIQTTLDSQYELYDLIDGKLYEMIGKTGNLNEEVDNAIDGLEEFNDTQLEDKNITIDIDGNTSGLESKTNKWWTNFVNTISGWFNKLHFKSIGSMFPFFDVGTNYVPQDTLAMVHKGEMIVPKKYNPMTSGLGGTNEETNALLRQLNNTLENKQFNGYISASDITNTAINGINQQSRIMGKSVIR